MELANITIALSEYGGKDDFQRNERLFAAYLPLRILAPIYDFLFHGYFAAYLSMPGAISASVVCTTACDE